jgi:hypothetical protein
MGFPGRKAGRLFDAQKSKESLKRQRICRMQMHRAKALGKGNQDGMARGRSNPRVTGLLVEIDASKTRV